MTVTMSVPISSPHCPRRVPAFHRLRTQHGHWTLATCPHCPRSSAGNSREAVGIAQPGVHRSRGNCSPGGLWPRNAKPAAGRNHAAR